MCDKITRSGLPLLRSSDDKGNGGSNQKDADDGHVSIEVSPPFGPMVAVGAFLLLRGMASSLFKIQVACTLSLLFHVCRNLRG